MQFNFQDQFRDAIRAAGIPPPDRVIADGSIHRFSSSGKPGDDAGWYWLRGGNYPFGFFGCWRDDFRSEWAADIGRRLTPQEEADRRAQMEAANRAAREQREQDHDNARRAATAAWDAATPGDDANKYLAKKGVKAHGVRVQPGDTLIVPMRDKTGTLHSIQRISYDAAGNFSKRFQRGGRVAGCFHLLGEPGDQICIAEGYATAASVFEATGVATVCAFNAGNLLAVAKAVRSMHPDAAITLCADDDVSGVGITKASEAARAIGGTVALPDWGGKRPEGATDFNDLASSRGREAIVASLTNAAAPEVAAPQPVAPNAVDADLEGRDSSAIDIKALVDAMNAIPAGEREKEWRNVGMGLHWETDAAADALAAWQAWLPEKAAQCPVAWSAFKGPDQMSVSPITGATILKLASEFGWKGSAASVKAVAPDAPWPGGPEPLVTFAESAPYPLDALPAGIGAAVREVIGFVQCPPALAACSALSALSIVGQGLANVRRAEGLTGPTSLYFLAIAESGERKTSADGRFASAIREWERQRAAAAVPDVAAHSAKMNSWTAKYEGVIAAIKQSAKGGIGQKNKAGKSAEDLDAALARLESEKPVAPRVPRLVYGDATPEALAFKLATEWPVGGVLSSEAGIVFGGHAMGADSAMRNMAALNVLWDGGTLTIDRKTSASFTVHGARLTMGLAAQPDTVRAFFDASKGLARGTGFAARFLIAWPASTQGERAFVEPPSGWPALTAFNQRLATLLDAVGPPTPTGEMPLPTLDLSEGARREWIKFHDDIELELRRGGDMAEIRDVASKAADNAARLAALFHIFEHGPEGAISAQHVRQAGEIVTWHAYEARRFLGELALPRDLGDAVKLDQFVLGRCRDLQASVIGANDARNFGPGSTRIKRRFDEAFAIISEACRARWIKIGRKLFVQVNPALMGVANGAT